MNMGFWVPEANFYRQSSFLVSCQIIAQTSSQLCPGHSKADVAKHRIWGWGRDNISEGLSEVYITYIFYCCELSWGCALPTDVCAHISFQSARMASSHLREFIGLWGNTGAHQPTEPEAEQGESWRQGSLYWAEKGKKWMDSPRFIWPVSSILFEQPGQSFCSEGLLQCKCFHQGNLYWTMKETMSKTTRGMLAEEMQRSWPYKHSLLNFERKSSPASEVVWAYIWIW